MERVLDCKSTGQPGIDILVMKRYCGLIYIIDVNWYSPGTSLQFVLCSRVTIHIDLLQACFAPLLRSYR